MGAETELRIRTEGLDRRRKWKRDRREGGKPRDRRVQRDPLLLALGGSIKMALFNDAPSCASERLQTADASSDAPNAPTGSLRKEKRLCIGCHRAKKSRLAFDIAIQRVSCAGLPDSAEQKVPVKHLDSALGTARSFRSDHHGSVSVQNHTCACQQQQNRQLRNFSNSALCASTNFFCSSSVDTDLAHTCSTFMVSVDLTECSVLLPETRRNRTVPIRCSCVISSHAL